MGNYLKFRGQEYELYDITIYSDIKVYCFITKIENGYILLDYNDNISERYIVLNIHQRGGGFSVERIDSLDKNIIKSINDVLNNTNIDLLINQSINNQDKYIDKYIKKEKRKDKINNILNE